jgi:hypothetical protein
MALAYGRAAGPGCAHGRLCVPGGALPDGRGEPVWGLTLWRQLRYMGHGLFHCVSLPR